VDEFEVEKSSQGDEGERDDGVEVAEVTGEDENTDEGEEKSLCEEGERRLKLWEMKMSEFGGGKKRRKRRTLTLLTARDSLPHPFQSLWWRWHCLRGGLRVRRVGREFGGGDRLSGIGESGGRDGAVRRGGGR
jgi:hypothetical protein